MRLAEAKEKFIESWGKLGSRMGINRTMAQVHALLLISPEAVTTEEIMESLSISRGNANMTLRELINWGLVEKRHKAGERKEYFFADKDVWNIARQVAKERKKRELDPMLKVLQELSAVEDEGNSAEVKVFKTSISNLHKLAANVNKSIETMVKAEENWFWSSLFKFLR